MPKRLVSSRDASGGMPALSQLRMSGHFAEKVLIVPVSYSSIILGNGQLGPTNEAVLVPFVEVTIHGITQGDMGDSITSAMSEDFEPPVVFQEALSLENALWLLSDLTRDLKIACSELKETTGGRAKLDPGRLLHAQIYAEQIRSQAEGCVAALASLRDEEERKSGTNITDVKKVVRRRTTKSKTS